MGHAAPGSGAEVGVSAPVYAPELTVQAANAVPVHAYCTCCTPFGSEVGTSV